MADLYTANITDPKLSAYGGAVLEAPRQDASTQMLVSGIGSLGIEAFKGEKEADLAYDLTSLEKQTQNANEVLFEGGETNVALSKFSDKMKNLDAGIFSGSLSPSEYKIKRELILKEHTKNMPGLAADFQQVYKSTGEDRTAEQFSMRKQMDAAAAEQAKSAAIAWNKVIDDAVDLGGNRMLLTIGSEEQKAYELHKYQIRNADNANYMSLERLNKMSAQEKVRVGFGLSQDLARSVIPTHLGGSVNFVNGLGKKYAPNVVFQADPAETNEVNAARYLAQVSGDMTPEQRIAMKQELHAGKTSALSTIDSLFVNITVPPEDHKNTTSVVGSRWDLWDSLIDDPSRAKMLEDQLKLETAANQLQFRRGHPELAYQADAMATMPRDLFNNLYGAQLTQPMANTAYKAITNDVKVAGKNALLVPAGTPIHKEIAQLDPDKKAGVLHGNLVDLNTALSGDMRNPKFTKTVLNSVQAYSDLPSDPNMLNMKEVDAYLKLLSNPNMPVLLAKDPEFGDKLFTNISTILEKKIKPYIAENVKEYITPDTRVVEVGDRIAFEGKNAAKLNKLAGVLNNIPDSLRHLGGMQDTSTVELRKALKQDVTTIIEDMRQPVTMPEKASTWFSNFLDVVSPDVGADYSRVGRGDALPISKQPEPATLPLGVTEKQGVYYKDGQIIGEKGLESPLIEPTDIFGIGAIAAMPLRSLATKVVGKTLAKEVDQKILERMPDVFKKAVFEASNTPAFKGAIRPDMLSTEARDLLKEKVIKNLDGLIDDVGLDVMSAEEKKFINFFKDGLVKKSKQEEVLVQLRDMADADPGAFSGMYDLFRTLGAK
jgi:hypothetical protein